MEVINYKLSRKIAVFKFLISEMVDRGYPIPDQYNKSFKSTFIFIICIIDKKMNNHNDNLLDIFDNFYALPHGHVEIDILKFLNGELQVGETQIDDVDKKKYVKIIDSITIRYPFLKKIEFRDIKNFCMSLPSWHETFYLARIENKSAKKIEDSLYLKDLDYPYSPLSVY